MPLSFITNLVGHQCCIEIVFSFASFVLFLLMTPMNLNLKQKVETLIAKLFKSVQGTTIIKQIKTKTEYKEPTLNPKEGSQIYNPTIKMP